MTVKRQIKRMGGSLGVVIPRDIAEAMNVKAGSEVRLTLVGRQVVVEPVDDTVQEGAFRRAFAAVLRRHGQAFEALAAHDQEASPARR
jgi:antitoxin component of MazEF toxin-antitoxin module